MPALFLSADLLFASRVIGAARQIGESVEVVATPDALITRCAASSTPLVIIDLSLPGLDVAWLTAQLQALPPPPRAVVAYAPHVHEDRLAAATEAGCTEVLSRGQFNSQIERVLRQYACS